eukprot:TRINITY_DN87801_c0_g1_i1.p2 TRINITY_DN87801_c0_g1~~TRINITY_DN87801_c0_g1_i1.p2  ORF type:complete len:107 (-),score=17.18 TRINITY_DN87801_c0_g1_i1:1-321(-)
MEIERLARAGWEVDAIHNEMKRLGRTDITKEDVEDIISASTASSSLEDFRKEQKRSSGPRMQGDQESESDPKEMLKMKTARIKKASPVDRSRKLRQAQQKIGRAHV